MYASSANQMCKLFANQFLFSSCKFWYQICDMFIMELRLVRCTYLQIFYVARAHAFNVIDIFLYILLFFYFGCLKKIAELIR